MWIVYKRFKLKSFFLRNHLTYTNKLVFGTNQKIQYCHHQMTLDLYEEKKDSCWHSVKNRLDMPDLSVMDKCSTSVVAYRRYKDRHIDTCMFLVFCMHLSSLLDKCLQTLGRLFAYIYFGKSLYTFIHMINI